MTTGDGAYRQYLRLSRFPTQWCPGCGLGTLLKATAQAIVDRNLGPDQVAIVSGIGCTGRSAGYFELDSVHGAHGRAIPLAEGIKGARPELEVIVVSGDGDLLGIGGNHLIHSIRRGIGLTVICAVNEIYGMTGGQIAPTTPRGVRTPTTPRGSADLPFDIQAIVQAHGAWFARTTTYHVRHLRRTIARAIEHTGFSFVAVQSQCTSNYGRRNGFAGGYEMLKDFKERFRLVPEGQRLGPDGVGVAP